MNTPLSTPALVAALCLHAGFVHAHPGHDESVSSSLGEPAIFLAQAAPPARADRRTNAPASGEKMENRVTITTDGEFRVIKSNGWPDHAPGAFPRRGNPNTVSPQDYSFRVPIKPVVADTQARQGHGFFAVAVNGVPFEPGTAETWNNDRSSGWRYEANTGFLDLGLDEHHAHVQPTGAYHYHGLPTGLIERLGGDGKKMLLIGWAADGFPLYSAYGYSDPKDAQSPLRKVKSSYQLKKGARPQKPGGPIGNYDGRFLEDWEYVKGSGDLDDCNGRAGVTPEFPQGTYAYFVTEEFPGMARQWRGTPDPSFGKGGGGPPGGGPGGPGGPNRRPGTLPAGILRDGAAGEDLSGAAARGRERVEPATSNPDAGREESAPGRMPPPPFITALDANGDGVIDAEELKAASASLRKLDKNGDGKLTPDEMHPPRAEGGGPPPGRQR